MSPRHVGLRWSGRPARPPLPAAPLPGTGACDSTEMVLGTESATQPLLLLFLTLLAPGLSYQVWHTGEVCGVQEKVRRQDLGSCCPQECTAGSRLLQLNPSEHKASMPATRVTALVTDQLLHRLMLGAGVREAASSLSGLVGKR